VTSTSPPSEPDEVERLFRRLVLNAAQLDPSILDGPLPIVEIHQNLVPYRTHRAVLAIDTNQDYEMTVLRFLAGEGGFAWVEPDEVRALFEREAQAVNPETGIFRRFPSATVRLEPDQTRGVLGGLDAARREEDSAGSAEAPAPMVAAPPARAADVPEPAFEIAAPMPPAALGEEDEQPELPFFLEDESDGSAETTGRDVGLPGAQCSYCGGELPVGRTVIFCPHCGQNVGVMHCPVCGTELDVGWRFCLTCGREMAGLG
jgi:hypothetical protein